MPSPKTQSILIACLTVLICLHTASPCRATQPISAICDIWPPYQYREQGKIVGYSTEIVQHVFKTMGVKMAPIQAFPWKRALSMFEDTHIDALFSANYTDERALFAYYPHEVLFESPWVVWGRKHNEFKTLEDLKGKTVGVVRGYSYTSEFWAFIEQHCTIQEVSNDDANFKKLDAGRVDAIAAELGNGYHLIQQHGLEAAFPQHDITIKRDGLYLLFNRDTVTQEFVNEFSHALREFKRSDAHRALRLKYLGE